MEHDYFTAVKIDGYFSVPNAPNKQIIWCVRYIWNIKPERGWYFPKK